MTKIIKLMGFVFLSYAIPHIVVPMPILVRIGWGLSGETLDGWRPLIISIILVPILVWIWLKTIPKARTRGMTIAIAASAMAMGFAINCIQFWR